jgi:hypothetical protein
MPPLNMEKIKFGKEVYKRGKKEKRNAEIGLNPTSALSIILIRLLRIYYFLYKFHVSGYVL